MNWLELWMNQKIICQDSKHSRNFAESANVKSARAAATTDTVTGDLIVAQAELTQTETRNNTVVVILVYECN